jgi:hypothetical protein
VLLVEFQANVNGCWVLFGVSEALTEPSAVAPDAGVYFSDNCGHKRALINQVAFKDPALPRSVL